MAETLFPLGRVRSAPAGREVARRYLAEARARLHGDPFPLVTERHAVDQALADTDRKEP